MFLLCDMLVKMSFAREHIWNMFAQVQHHFQDKTNICFNMFMSINSWTLFWKAGNHAFRQSKSWCIKKQWYLPWFWHFWRLHRCCQSAFFLVHALSVWCLKLSTKVFGSTRVAKANLRKLSACAMPMRATHFPNLGSFSDSVLPAMICVQWDQNWRIVKGSCDRAVSWTRWQHFRPHYLQPSAQNQNDVLLPCHLELVCRASLSTGMSHVWKSHATVA